MQGLTGGHCVETPQLRRNVRNANAVLATGSISVLPSCSPPSPVQHPCMAAEARTNGKWVGSFGNASGSLMQRQSAGSPASGGSIKWQQPVTQIQGGSSQGNELIGPSSTLKSASEVKTTCTFIMDGSIISKGAPTAIASAAAGAHAASDAPSSQSSGVQRRAAPPAPCGIGQPCEARLRLTCAVRGRPIRAYRPNVVMLNSRLVAALCVAGERWGAHV